MRRAAKTNYMVCPTPVNPYLMGHPVLRLQTRFMAQAHNIYVRELWGTALDSLPVFSSRVSVDQISCFNTELLFDT